MTFLQLFNDTKICKKSIVESFYEHSHKLLTYQASHGIIYVKVFPTCFFFFFVRKLWTGPGPFRPYRFHEIYKRVTTA